VQKRAAKLVNGFKNLRRLKLTTLEKRRLRGDLVKTFKIMTAVFVLYRFQSQFAAQLNTSFTDDRQTDERHSTA